MKIIDQKLSERIYEGNNVDAVSVSILKQNSDKIYVFDVKSGFVNLSEAGYTHNSDPEDFARFERIYTGEEAVSLVWRDSSAVIVDNSIPGTNVIRKRFGLGKMILGRPDVANSTNSIAPVRDTDFLKEQVETELTYYVKTNLTKKDLLARYVIPGKYGSEVFYIDNFEYYNNPGTNTFKYGVLTLRSENDRIATSGLAIDQFVQFSAPGEGYAFPKDVNYLKRSVIRDYTEQGLVYDTVDQIPSGIEVGSRYIVNNYSVNDYSTYGVCLIEYTGAGYNWEVISNTSGYIIDEEKLISRPITSVQFESDSPSILSSIYMMGRPIQENEFSGNEIIEESRLIFIDKFQSYEPTQRDATKPGSTTDKFYWLGRSNISVESWYDDWKEKWGGANNPSTEKKWTGALRFDGNDMTISHTSVEEVIWSKAFFWNPSWLWNNGILHRIYSQDRYDINARSYPTSGSIWSALSSQGNWRTRGAQTLPKLLARGYWKHRVTPILPLSYSESIPWTLKNIPIIGSVLDGLTLGLPNWKNQTSIGGEFYNIDGWVSASLIDFFTGTTDAKSAADISADGSTEFTSANKNYFGIPMTFFDHKSDPQILEPQDYKTILKGSISDMKQAHLMDNNWNRSLYEGDGQDYLRYIKNTDDWTRQGGIWNNVNIGAIEFGNNEDEIARYSWSDNSAPAPKDINTDGYAIDLFGFHQLGKGSFKVTFFDKNDNAVWSGSYKTLSEVTGGVRDWNTNLKLSFWDSLEFVPSNKPVNLDNVVGFEEYTPGELLNGTAQGQMRADILTENVEGVQKAVKTPEGHTINEYTEQGNQLFSFHKANSSGIFDPDDPNNPIDPDEIEYYNFTTGPINVSQNAITSLEISLNDNNSWRAGLTQAVLQDLYDKGYTECVITLEQVNQNNDYDSASGFPGSLNIITRDIANYTHDVDVAGEFARHFIRSTLTNGLEITGRISNSGELELINSNYTSGIFGSDETRGEIRYRYGTAGSSYTGNIFGINNIGLRFYTHVWHANNTNGTMSFSCGNINFRFRRNSSLRLK